MYFYLPMPHRWRRPLDLWCGVTVGYGNRHAPCRNQWAPWIYNSSPPSRRLSSCCELVPLESFPLPGSRGVRWRNQQQRPGERNTTVQESSKLAGPPFSGYLDYFRLWLPLLIPVYLFIASSSEHCKNRKEVSQKYSYVKIKPVAISWRKSNFVRLHLIQTYGFVINWKSSTPFAFIDMWHQHKQPYGEGNWRS